MNEQFRILILEDMATDADLAVREIKSVLPKIETKRVETKDAFMEALSEFVPDLILSDFRLPGFDGLAALELAKAHMPDTPFIIFTGSINEETAVHCMKAGATDYVLKDHMQRLGPAIQSSLQQSQMRIERKLAEEKSRRWKMIFDKARFGLAQTDVVSNTFIEVNATYASERGYCPEELQGQSITTVFPPEMHATVKDTLEKVDRMGHGVFESVHQRRDGSQFPVLMEITTIVDEQGQPALRICYSLDITERKQAERDLLKAQTLLNATERITKTGGWEYDLETKKISWTDEVYRIHELAKDYDPTNHELNMAFYAPEDQATIGAAFQKAVTHGESYDLQLRLIPAQGDPKWVRTSGKAEVKNGKPIRVFGHITDITEQLKLEQQLQQAQKMESVGRLAGGVAHDYNNLLSVILGYAELAMNKVDPADSLHADLMEILQAAERSRNITRQLLTFARKQTILPKVLDLNVTIELMLKILRRLIGEDINLSWKPASELWPIRIDPSQIDQILANLCVNARDAINGVGQITIETKSAILGENFCLVHPDCKPGEYVCLKVSDTGNGIDAGNLDKIFEPFFTTKGVGKGTGLGLSMVYGAVKQNNGFVYVNSEEGKGTTFALYFPRCEEKQNTKYKGPREIGVKKGKGEKILLVEDDISLLNLTANILKSLGYRVEAAQNPQEAIRIVEGREDPIDLLITDVVMPEINGHDLAKYLSSLFPNLKCLFMSGYTADIIAKQGFLEKEINLIDKPFLQKDLSIAIRKILEKDDG